MQIIGCTVNPPQQQVLNYTGGGKIRIYGTTNGEQLDLIQIAGDVVKWSGRFPNRFN